MTTLKASTRNPEIKAKKLRRDGFTTGVLLGKDMKSSIPLQFVQKDAMHLIKNNKEGAQVTLDMDNGKVNAIVKNIDYDPMKKQIQALDFLALVAGEKISTSVPVKLINEDYVQGFVGQELAEIHYKADPSNLLDPVEIDLKELSPKIKSVYVKDLQLDKGKTIDFITPEDTLIFYIGDVMSETDSDSSDEEIVEEAPAEKTE